jgi:hypothetical protein
VGEHGGFRGHGGGDVGPVIAEGVAEAAEVGVEGLEGGGVGYGLGGGEGSLGRNN